MILHPLCLLPTRPFSKPNPQIRARAENSPTARNHDALDALVGVEHGVRRFDLRTHCVGKGIVVRGAVEREDDDRGFFLVVSRLNLREGQVVVGRGEDDVRVVARGLLARGHGCDAENW
jgi:hypothetical protein